LQPGWHGYAAEVADAFKDWNYFVVDMINHARNERLAVCSWSLQPADPKDLSAKVRSTGVGRVQLALDPLLKNPGVWGRTADLLRAEGLAIVSGMFGCEGEDYSTLESIRRTGGIAPDSTWKTNWKNIQATATLAKELGLKLVTFHAGFLPHEERDPNFVRLQHRLTQVADLFSSKQIGLALETGQELASELLQLLRNLNHPGLGVNFDPANMILYDKGDPIAALRTLGPWIRQVHIKDATRTRKPGTWGEEVAAGSGEVDWRAFFATLRELDFQGDFVIEREAGGQRIADIATARELVDKLGCSIELV
jgi:sugar phosphate isomerase/epimerase